MIKLITLNQNEIINNIFIEDNLIFLIRGKVMLTSANRINFVIDENYFTYLSVKEYYSLSALESSTLLIIKIREQILFSDSLDIGDLARYFVNQNYSWANELYLLEMNEEIKILMDFVQICLNRGISSEIFYKNKVNELLFLLDFFYTKKELAFFFHNALNIDSKFRFDVMSNRNKCKSVIELAQSLNYSVSGFEKHFKQVFGISPYKWMLQNKAKMVYDEIRLNKRSFKEICNEYNFSSVSHFTNFCKAFLGATPSSLRKYSNTVVPKLQSPQSMDEVSQLN